MFLKKKIIKGVRYASLALAFAFPLSGAIGYGIINFEPETETVIQEVQRTISVDKDAIQEKIDRAEFSQDVDFARGSEIAEARKHYESSVKDYGIGAIYVPSADISVPILAGTSEWNLFNGVATASAEQELGEGLYVGLSHNLINETLLENIDKMKTGDIIYATDFEYVYYYRTLEREVVHETDTTYFREPSNSEQPKMLLYRCEGGYGTEWRNVAYAEYVTRVPIQEVDEHILQGLKFDVDLAQEQNVEKETIEKEITEFIEVQQEVEKEPKNFFEEKLYQFTQKIGENEKLENFFLDVYKFADGNTGVYALIVFLLIAVFALL